MRCKGMKKKLYSQVFSKKTERLFENNTLPLPPVWHKCCYLQIKNLTIITQLKFYKHDKD